MKLCAVNILVWPFILLEVSCNYAIPLPLAVSEVKLCSAGII